jgi:predicted amidohydrolase
MRKLTLGAATMKHPKLDGKEPLPESALPRLEEADRLLQEAARRGCDVLCLPELFADPTQGIQLRRFAEPPGGPVCEWLAGRARALRMALAATVALRGEGGVTNSGLVYDKSGRLAGRYDKVHLPPGEDRVAAAGRDFPVFEVEGVRVGMQICYDLAFPEGCRILALRGAELVLWPNMWGGMPEAFTDVVMRARAMENGVHLVSSGFVLSGDADFRAAKVHGRSCVIDPAGVVLAEVGCRTGVAVATVDFDAPRPADLPGAPLAHRRPEAYGPLVAGGG